MYEKKCVFVFFLNWQIFRIRKFGFTDFFPIITEDLVEVNILIYGRWFYLILNTHLMVNSLPHCPIPFLINQG